MTDIFPLLNKEFIYFDAAATNLKPNSVIEAQSRYYTDYGLNIGRGSSLLNYKSSDIIENIRVRTAEFIGSTNPNELVFTSNATDSINIVAQGYVKNRVKKNSNIVITMLEHHSNYVPWINLAKEMDIECRIIPLDGYSLDYSYIDKYIDENTIITSVTGMSNITGEVTDLTPFITRCREKGSKILVDAAQLIGHKRVNVTDLDIDFLVFSAHKLFGPFGLGFLYGKFKNLEEITPTRFGGNMVSYINNLTHVHYREIPRRLESGTQNPGAIFAFDAVLDFLEIYKIEDNEKKLIQLSSYLLDRLKSIPGLIIYSEIGSIISFNIIGVHPHDASDFFDNKNIVVRTGNLCASPFFTNLEQSGVVRVSLGIYNNKNEIDRLIDTIIEIKEFFL